MRPPIELMKTMRPRARRICGSIAWVTATWPVRLTSIWRRKSSIGIVSSGPGHGDAGVVDEAVEAALALRADPLGRGGDLLGRR